MYALQYVFVKKISTANIFKNKFVYKFGCQLGLSVKDYLFLVRTIISYFKRRLYQRRWCIYCPVSGFQGPRSCPPVYRTLQVPTHLVPLHTKQEGRYMWAAVRQFMLNFFQHLNSNQYWIQYLSQLKYLHNYVYIENMRIE